MKVTDIIIDNFIHRTNTGGTKNSGGVYRFYDKNGDLVKSGDIISGDITYPETENFSMRGCSTWYDAGNYVPIYAFYTGYYESCIPQNEYIAVSHVDNGSVYLKIAFKNPIELSKIECNFSAVCLANSAGVCSAGGDVTINFVNGESKKYTLVNEDLTAVNVIHTIEMPQHEVNVPQYIITTENSNVKNLNRINGFTIGADIPEDTDMRFAISFDNRNTFKIFNGTNWENIDATSTNIIQNGMTKEQIENITKENLSLLIDYLSNTNIDFYVAMITYNSYCTPILNSININYMEES